MRGESSTKWGESEKLIGPVSVVNPFDEINVFADPMGVNLRVSRKLI
jgi:hypothetical protein